MHLHTIFFLLFWKHIFQVFTKGRVNWIRRRFIFAFCCWCDLDDNNLIWMRNRNVLWGSANDMQNPHPEIGNCWQRTAGVANIFAAICERARIIVWNSIDDMIWQAGNWGKWKPGEPSHIGEKSKAWLWKRFSSILVEIAILCECISECECEWDREQQLPQPQH